MVVEFDLHFAEVVSVSPQAQAAVRVVSADVGARAGRSWPSSSRPRSAPRCRKSRAWRCVRSARVRRVRSFAASTAIASLVLQDGQRMGDLSSQSGDHGVPVNPAAARRIEVVRGPATLAVRRQCDRRSRQRDHRSDSRPSRRRAPTGDFTLDFGSNGGEGRRRRRRSCRQRQVCPAHRRRRPSHRQLRHARRRSGQLAVAHGHGQRRRRPGPATTPMPAPATATTIRSTAFRSSRRV